MQNVVVFGCLVVSPFSNVQAASYIVGPVVPRFPGQGERRKGDIGSESQEFYGFSVFFLL